MGGLHLAVFSEDGQLAEAALAGLTDPSWAPPKWILGPLWTALYASVAAAVGILIFSSPGRLAAAAPAAAAVVLQAAFFTLAWAPAAVRGPGWAAVVAAAGAVTAVAAAAAARSVARTAGHALLPYVAWSIVTAAYSLQLWWLNSGVNVGGLEGGLGEGSGGEEGWAVGTPRPALVPAAVAACAGRTPWGVRVRDGGVSWGCRAKVGLRGLGFGLGLRAFGKGPDRAWVRPRGSSGVGVRRGSLSAPRLRCAAVEACARPLYGCPR